MDMIPNIPKSIRIGTRGSELALRQVALVEAALLARFPEMSISVEKITTTGDRKQGTPLARQEDKREWILEIESAVGSGDIDLAIHSGKDVPVDIDERTLLFPVLQRADCRDVFIGRLSGQSRTSFSALPADARIGTSSLRRGAQLLRHRPQFQIVDYRGNVTTRLKRLDECEDIDGIVLAGAGLARLGRVDVEIEPIDTNILMPAVNQGSLGAQIHRERSEMKLLVQAIQHPASVAAWIGERSTVARLGAGCNSAVGVIGEVQGATFLLRARVLSRDGGESIERSITGSVDDAEALGLELGSQLLSLGAARLLG